MELKNQVCTLEQSEKLQELGIECASIFVHHSWLDEDVNKWQSRVMLQSEPLHEDMKYALADGRLPAFTVAELGVMLPSEWLNPLDQHDTKTENIIGCWKTPKGMFRYRMDEDDNECSKPMNEAQARAAMLIYLLENNYVTAAECNARLNA